METDERERERGQRDDRMDEREEQVNGPGSALPAGLGVEEGEARAVAEEVHGGGRELVVDRVDDLGLEHWVALHEPVPKLALLGDCRHLEGPVAVRV